MALVPEYNLLKPSYCEIHNACINMAIRIQSTNHNIKQVAGISRGGLLPALILSHLLKLPLMSIDYSSKSGEGDDKNHTNELPLVSPDSGNMLVVDDICDSGKTMKEVVSHFQQYVDTYTAVLYYKFQIKPLVCPDYVWRTLLPDSDWVVFPFERVELL